MPTIGSSRQRRAIGRFVGRYNEQRKFRETLKQLADLRNRREDQLTDDNLTYAQIFLIAAEGGMGKSTLLRRFEEIVNEQVEGMRAKFNYINYVDMIR